MTEQELRTLVRDAVTRHIGARPVPSAGSALLPVRQHASHMMFSVPEGSETDGPCLIEPTVMCNHCGYCKSMGH
jgi:hypothetical protein